MTYSEDSFAEQPAIKLFKSLDWQTLNCWDEIFGEESPLGRENRGDVILQNRLYPILVKLNPKAPKLVIDEAILALRRDRSAMIAVTDFSRWKVKYSHSYFTLVAKSIINTGCDRL